MLDTTNKSFVTTAHTSFYMQQISIYLYLLLSLFRLFVIMGKTSAMNSSGSDISFSRIHCEKQQMFDRNFWWKNLTLEFSQGLLQVVWVVDCSVVDVCYLLFCFFFETVFHCITLAWLLVWNFLCRSA